MKPFTKRSDFNGRGGQMCIHVYCLPTKALFFLKLHKMYGQLSKSNSDNWQVRTESLPTNNIIVENVSLNDIGITVDSLYNSNALFPFSSRLLAKLQEFVNRKDYDGYISFVSESLSGADKEKWDEYCAMRLNEKRRCICRK